MKKLILIVLMFGVMLTTAFTYGAPSGTITLNDDDFLTINYDEVTYRYEYNETNGKYYIIPDTTPTLKTDDYTFEIDNVDFVTIYFGGVLPTDGYYVIESGFTIEATNFLTLLDYYKYIVFKDSVGQEIIIPLLDDYEQLFEFKLNATIDSGALDDIDGDVMIVSDGVDQGYIQSTGIQVYLLEDILPDHQNWLQLPYTQYWSGAYTTDDNMIPSGISTYNYFGAYTRDYILPMSWSSDNFDDNVDNFVTQLTTTGIDVIIPPHTQLAVFVYAWYEAGIDPWYEIAGTELIETTMNITASNDLVYEGSWPDGTGEFWATSITYTYDGETYTFNQLDEFSNIVAPHIGIRTDTGVFSTVTYHTNGGSVIPVQNVAFGFQPYPVSNPTRAGYVFRGWSAVVRDSYVILNSDFFIGVNPSSYVITEDRNFYAMWSYETNYVTFTLNGGSFYTLPNFTNSLTIPLGLTVNDNENGVDFDSIVYRFGYTLEGWYIDAGLTTEFNEATPISDDLMLYANWVEGTTNAPNAINDLLIAFDLFNPAGLFIIYFVILMCLIIPSVYIGLSTMVMLIETIALTALWMFLGFFPLWVVIILILIIIVVFASIMKGGSNNE